MLIKNVLNCILGDRVTLQTFLLLYPPKKLSNPTDVNALVQLNNTLVVCSDQHFHIAGCNKHCSLQGPLLRLQTFSSMDTTSLRRENCLSKMCYMQNKFKSWQLEHDATSKVCVWGSLTHQFNCIQMCQWVCTSRLDCAKLKHQWSY